MPPPFVALLSAKVVRLRQQMVQCNVDRHGWTIKDFTELQLANH
jgi:hypothetical protein